MTGQGKEVIDQEVIKLVVRHRMVNLERTEGWENVESQEQRESQEGDPLERTLQMVSPHSCEVGWRKKPKVTEYGQEVVSILCY